MSRVTTALAVGLTLLATAAPVLAFPDAAIDYNSMLSRIRIFPTGPGADQSKGGSLMVEDVLAVFIPQEHYYTGQANYEAKVFGVLRRAGEQAELARFGFYVMPMPTVFCRLQVQQRGDSNYQFEQPGDYTLDFECDGKPIGQLPFTVSFKQSGDAFNPQRYTVYDGPWRDWACMVLPDNDPEKNPLFRIWTRGGVFNAPSKTEQIMLSIRHEGDEIFTASPVHVGDEIQATCWSRADFHLEFPKAEGGDAIRTKHLLTNDGDYQVLLSQNDKVVAAYAYTIKGGKFVPHEHQDVNHQPRTEYKAGRSLDVNNRSEELFWMKRLNTDEARRALSATPAAATASTEQRGSWVVTPAIDMARPFKVVVTQAKTRMDSHLAAGDGVIAFGTGSNKGVAFLRVGATGEESIPDGSSYSSKAFAVCGKKIVLTRDQQVFVYDTQSGQTAEVPAGEINLARGGDPSRKLQADGNLVITVNDPKKVDDRVVVKVIDVSGAAPRVIPIKNAGLTSQDITSVAIDAETGKLVIGSKRKKAIYVADVAPKAEPKGLDLSGHDGFGDYPMLLSGGFAYYADGSGSPKFRMVDLAGSQVVTTGDWGTKAFAASGQHYAFEHDAPASGPDQFVIGTAPAAPQQPANSGGSIPDCNGKFGQGTSVAVAPSGAVFVAGDKGLGSGEFLHASTGGDWVAIRGADGKPIPATDVTMGDYVLAFRTGARNDTMVAYATFGAKITLPGGQQ